MKELTDLTLTQLIQPRSADSHKGTFGRALLIGGNQQYGGAIMMSTLATVAVGAGLTTVVTTSENHIPLHVHCPEAMVLDCKDIQAITAAIKKSDVLLIGPGLGTDQTAITLLKLVFTHQRPDQWLVVDGSAITLVARLKLELPHPAVTIFTPHQMEWERLAQLPIAEQTSDKNQQVQQKLGVYVVLKSHRTEVYTLDECYKNPLGTPAMATGGMGDTLAGMIVGFLAQFPDKIAALLSAVYLHSYIGEQLALYQYVVLPTAIIRHIPVYMKQFELKNP
ncbi:NAD(P)H-hydrate dehydratase [Enterococcus faecalis]